MSDKPQPDRAQQALEEIKAIEKKYNIAVIGVIILRSGTAAQFTDITNLPPGASMGYAIVEND